MEYGEYKPGKKNDLCSYVYDGLYLKSYVLNALYQSYESSWNVIAPSLLQVAPAIWLLYPNSYKNAERPTIW